MGIVVEQGTIKYPGPISFGILEIARTKVRYYRKTYVRTF